MSFIKYDFFCSRQTGVQRWDPAVAICWGYQCFFLQYCLVLLLLYITFPPNTTLLLWGFFHWVSVQFYITNSNENEFFFSRQSDSSIIPLKRGPDHTGSPFNSINSWSELFIYHPINQIKVMVVGQFIKFVSRSE